MKVFIGVYNSEGGVTDAALLERKPEEIMFMVIRANHPGRWKVGDIVPEYLANDGITAAQADNMGLFYWHEAEYIIIR